MSVLKNELIAYDPEAMKAAAEALGFKITGKKPETQVKQARAVFESRMKGIAKDDLIQCPVCGELTDDTDDLESCPYCGDAGLDEDAPEPQEDNDGEEDAPKGIEAEGVEDDEPEAEEPPAANIDGDGEDAPVTPPKDSPSEDAPEPGGDAGADNETPPDQFQLAQSLAKEEDTIRQQQTNMLDSGYEMGLSLKRVRDGELWKARGHKHFKAFCKSVSVNTPLAYRLMELVTQFDKQAFLDIDRTKLMIIAAAPKKDRAALEKAARDGASKRKLEREAKAAKAKRDAEDGKDNKDGKGLPGRPFEAKAITLLAKVGGRPKTVGFKSKKDRKDVKFWDKDSFAEIQISDDVTQFIALKTDKDGKVTGVTVAYKRAEPSKDGEDTKGK